MTARFRILAAVTTAAGLALLAACQDGSVSTSAAGSPASGGTSAASSPPSAAPSGALLQPSPTAQEVAAQAALQGAQAAASSATAATTPSAAGSLPTAAQPGATWPAEVPYPVEGRVWVVYLAVSRDDSAAERSRLEAALTQVRGHGYSAALGVAAVACEQGAATALGLDPHAHGAPLFFATRAQAQQFVAKWARPYAGYAQVTENCTA